MRELRLVLLGLAAIIALLLGAEFLLRAFQGEIPRHATAPETPITRSEPAPRSTLSPEALVAARAPIERAIADTPDYARFFDRLRLVFPSEYDSIMNKVAEADQGKEVNVDNVMAEATASLRASDGAGAAKAPSPALEQIFALQLDVMRALAEPDPHLCVIFLDGSNVAGFQAFAADHRPLVADVAIALLDAINGGRTERIDRGDPSPADFHALDRALVDKGLTRPEIDALLDGKAPEPPISDTTMCQAGQTYLETLAGLPTDVRERLYSLSARITADTR